MIILVGAQKGGIGKSTIAVNLCAYLAQAGADFILVDTDSGDSGQKTASDWVEDRDQTNLPEVGVVQATGDIRNSLKKLDSKYDFVLVDAAGRDSRELRTGMLIADLAVVPFGAGKPERRTMQRVHEIVTGAQDLNPSLKVIAFLNKVATNVHLEKRKLKRVQSDFSDYPDLQLMQSILHFRDAFEEAWEDGRGVIEIEGRSAQKAKQEFLALIEELLSLSPEMGKLLTKGVVNA